MTSGFLRKCKVCESLYRRAYYKRNSDKARKDAKRWRDDNLEQAQAKEREWRQNNPEKVVARDKAWREANKERKAANDKAYREENTDRIRVVQRRWRQENTEKKREADRRYHRENPGLRALYSRRYFARKRGQQGERYTNEDVFQMYDDQQGLCAYCEVPLFGAYHVDHMLPISRGGLDDLRNLAITCPTCNLRKNSRTAEEFMNYLKLVGK